MKTFEERLYNHKLYTYSLYNIGLDLQSFIKEFNNEIIVNLKKYTEGKISTINIIIDDDRKDELEQYLDNLFQIREKNYLEDIYYEFINEENTNNCQINFWINI